MSELSFATLDRQERAYARAQRRVAPLAQQRQLSRMEALGTLSRDYLRLQAPALGVSPATLDRILALADDDGAITPAEFERVAGLAANAKQAGDRFEPTGAGAVADLGAIAHNPATAVSTTYYEKRAADFEVRHPGVPAPRYYLQYGDKYIDRFSQTLYPKLSPAGQAWLVKARSNLQQAIEAELAKNPGIELHDERFQDFAYNSHVEAYLGAGLARLPLRDWVEILKTPDLRDMFSRRGLKQVAQIGLAVLKARLLGA